MNRLKKYLDILDQKGFLSSQESYEAFFTIVENQNSAEEIKNFLLKINQKKITASLLYGAAKALLEKSIKLKAPENAIDVCGTGGDLLHTLNISTAVSFVIAASEIPVVKHGNRAVSSSSGSADIFAELGINIHQTPQQAEKSLFENNLAFVFAPLYHPALKNLTEIRKEIGVKTIFNYLGPLLNPANIKFQLIGCSDSNIAPIMLETAKMLDKENCCVVSALDGMDEISISTETMIYKMENKTIFPKEIFNPEKYGYKKVPIESIQGKDPKYNAGKLLDLLKGEKSDYYNIVVLNAALALILSHKTSNFPDGIEMAKNAIDSGKALNILKKLQNNQ
jgi:anthranilate phosphoribosyltransferase